MPQSRHRKSVKARKKPKGTYAPAASTPRSTKNRSVRLIAIVIVVALAVSAIVYVVTRRRSSEVTTASGLKYVDIQEGTGPTPQRGQTLSVHYTGTLQNGTKFDSSRDRGTPMEFQYGVTSMIRGWDEGISSMKVGGKRKLIVPPALGYGAAGRPPSIPPNSTLIFEIELLGIN
ncbi:MAG TPA: FKBP-type peptidyl-prolyl cis-trans isomerase [Pyrinomonadaceae bacterium]